MMMTSAQVITHALLSSKSVFIGFTLTQNLSFPYMFHRRVTTIFHYVLIGEQTQTFVLITTVFGFAIGNHFSWAWRFGWRHVTKQRGKWTIEWGLKLSDTTYLMIVFPHWFMQFSKFPISAIHGPRICSNRTLKYNTHHNAIGTTFGETI